LSHSDTKNAIKKNDPKFSLMRSPWPKT